MSDRIMIDMSYQNMGSARVYEKIVPILTSRDYKEPRLILEKNIMTENKIKIIGRMDNTIDHTFESANANIPGGSYKYLAKEDNKDKIRKLTEKETWRLMGFTDEDFNKARAVNSATQCYKQAGNSIVKQVLMAIFSQLNIKGVKTWNEEHK